MYTLLKEKKEILLYSVCFFFLMIIEWIRFTQKWNIWATSLNLIGVFMAIIIATSLSWKKEKITPYIFLIIIWIISTLIAYNIWKLYPGRIFKSQLFTASFSLGCLSVVTLKMFRSGIFKEKLKKISKLNWIKILLFTLLSLFMFLSPYEDCWTPWFLWMFLLLYFLPLNKEKKQVLLQGMTIGILLGFFAIQGFALIFRPYWELRYQGAFVNCNMNALFYVTVYTVVLYRLYLIITKEKKDKKDKIQKLFYFILACSLLGLIQFTLCRTALVSIATITFLYGICLKRIYHNGTWKKTIQHWILLCIGMFIFLPIIYLPIRYIPTLLHHPYWFWGEHNTKSVQAFDPYDSETYISFPQFLDYYSYRVIDQATEYFIGDNYISIKAFAKTTEENQFISSINSTEPILKNCQNSLEARLAIFKVYLENLNWNGHYVDDGMFPITETYTSWHAQNLFIQILFFYGIPAGVISIILGLWYVLETLYKSIIKRNKNWILSLFTLSTFLSFGMLECVWYPGQMILFLVFFSYKFTTND